MSSDDRPSSQVEDQEQTSVEGEVSTSTETPDDSEESSVEISGDATIEQLQQQLQEAQVKADDNWEQVLLARADLSNVQRRAERDLENAHKFGMEKVVRELLPVLDSLELGCAAAAADQPNPVKVKEGIDLTLKMLIEAVGKLGVEHVDPGGETFNPEFHQAMSTLPTSDIPPNKVMTVYQKGYLLNNRLIRPAMVVVSAALSNASDENSQKVDETA